MKIEIRFTLVDNENWLLANLYALTSINKKTFKKNENGARLANQNSRVYETGSLNLERSTAVFNY